MTHVRREARPSHAPGSAASRTTGSPTGKNDTEKLLPRVLSGLFLIIAALGSLWLGGDWFGLFWLIAAFGVEYEWQTLIGTANPLRRFAFASLSLAFVERLALAGHPEISLECLVAAAALTGLAAGPRRRIWAACGVLYAGAMLVAVTTLRVSVPFGATAVFWLFAVVWTNDIMAFFGGRLIGGRRLWPAISPSKTWAGFIIGNLAGALAGAAVAPGGVSLASFLLGLVCGIAAQFGDLAESSIKRHFGVKDAGAIIPGHGGVMDRLDGFVAAAVLAAAVGVASRGLESAGAGLFSW